MQKSKFQIKIQNYILKPRLVLFDIDRTLVAGGYPACVQRFSYVSKKYLGCSPKIDWGLLDGTTDKVIFHKILMDNGLKKEEIERIEEEIFEAAYDYVFKRIKADYKQHLIKEAVDLIKTLHKKKNIYLALLTGNQESIGRLKMEIVGLSDYFRFGLYGDKAEDRNALAKMVFAKAKAVLGLEFLPQNIYIIGDTPNDIACGKYIGAKTIGVATGFKTISELKKARADLAVKTLADKRVLKFIIE